MKKVLLTGASGYIGKHITLLLLQDGYTVVASVRALSKADEVRSAVQPLLPKNFNLAKKLTFVELDLEKDAGWGTALKGIDVLLHTASPFPIASPKDENDLIRPAVDGTLRALKAAHKAGVKRVVLTSSVAAVDGNDLPAGKTELDETMWTDVNHPKGSAAYTKSKTLAEQAAWEYIKTTAPEIALTTINPALVIGAPLDKQFGSSVSIIERILKASDPLLPDVAFSLVDVKNVADMHVNAIGIDASKNKRFLASSETMSFIEIANIIKAQYPNRKVNLTKAPNFIIRILGLFDGDIRRVVPILGKRILINNNQAHKVLKIKFIPAKQSIIETADYLIKNGFVKN
jgi:dihydroflavonol-4-reductase